MQSSLAYTDLTWDTGWDDDNVGTSQCVLEAIIGWKVTFDDRWGVDVRDISCNSWSVNSVRIASRKKEGRE